MKRTRESVRQKSREKSRKRERGGETETDRQEHQIKGCEIKRTGADERLRTRE